MSKKKKSKWLCRRCRAEITAEKELPKREIPLTRQERQNLIDSLRTPVGGFKRVDLASIGIKWPPKSGWLKRFVDGE